MNEVLHSQKIKKIIELLFLGFFFGYSRNILLCPTPTILKVMKEELKFTFR